MTDRNVKLRQGSKWESFWSELKKGYDLFEPSHVPPAVSVCKGHYVFEAGTRRDGEWSGRGALPA